MEGRQNESHVSEMAVTSLERQAACLARSALVRDTHAPVERTIRNNRSIMFEIEEFPVRDLDDALVDNIIVGPIEHERRSVQLCDANAWEGREGDRRRDHT